MPDRRNNAQQEGDAPTEPAPPIPAQEASPTASRRLTYGQHLGPIEVRELIGAGAMGEVYRARDTRLDRDIAIKVLPASFAADRERMSRFAREARSLASVNHPNIAQIYGVDEAEGTHFISLELVAGDSLAEHLRRGKLPLQEALKICRDISDGLEAAHEASVVHRDLKPDNIRLTPDGTAKILDFGIAKPLPRLPDGHPTESTLATEQGAILGTPTYMSPEHIRGKPVDRRTDIWAFGCVLFECLTGRRPFGGNSFSDIAAAVVTATPDTLLLDEHVPARVEQLIERCLRKDPRERLRDIGDARIELEDTIAGRSQEPRRGKPRPTRSTAPFFVAVATAGAAIALTIGTLLPERQAPPITRNPAARYSITLPPASEGLVLDSTTDTCPPIAISPDGRQVVFLAVTPDGHHQLHSRSAESNTIVPLENTTRADSAFFSESGDRLLVAHHNVKGVYVWAPDGSLSPVLERVGALLGASLGSDDQLVFAEQGSGLSIRHLPDGPVTTLTTPAPDEFDHRWPQVLPGGERILFTANLESGTGPVFQPRILTVATRESLPLANVNGTFARFLPDDETPPEQGFLVYVARRNLVAVRVDVDTGETLGEPRKIVSGIHVSQRGTPHYAVSASGVLVYEPQRPPSPGRELVWVDRQGMPETLSSEHGFEFPRIARSGTRIAFADHTETDIHEIWAVALVESHPFAERVVSAPGNWIQPNWSPDGTGMVIGDFRTRRMSIQQPLDSSPRELNLPMQPHSNWAMQLHWWDENRIIYQELNRETQWDLREVDLATNTPRDLLATPFSEMAAQLSPDGNWLAYVSDENGHPTVFLQRYDRSEPLGPPRITIAPGSEPLWSRDGNELFFRRANQFLAVAFSPQDGRPLGEPRELFRGPYVLGVGDVANYDVSTDASRFIMVAGDWGLTRGRLDVHLNLLEELRAALPAH